MFRTVFQSIIRISRLYIQQQAFVKQILLSACQQVLLLKQWESILPHAAPPPAHFFWASPVYCASNLQFTAFYTGLQSDLRVSFQFYLLHKASFVAGCFFPLSINVPSFMCVGDLSLSANCLSGFETLSQCFDSINYAQLQKPLLSMSVLAWQPLQCGVESFQYSALTRSIEL